MRSFIDQMRDRFRRTETRRTKAVEDAEAHENRLWQFFLQTGLLAIEWYKENNSDVVGAGVDVVEHFRSYGWREGRWPNPFFDPTWYLQKNPEVAHAGLNPIIHYWLYGEKENRKPHPLFDPNWYRHAYAQQAGNANLLAHYLRNRESKQFSPNPWFDIDFYLKTQPDVAGADVDPFTHFITTGFREGRNPHPSFHVQFYLQQYMSGDPRDPITHYMEIGLPAGYATVPSETANTQASEIRRFSRASPEFEETNPNIAKGLPHRAKVLAYYLPQFHTFPENDKWWGRGFTEWTNIGRGTPRFSGHYQPRVPRDFGFYDLKDPHVMPLQIAAAKAAGLYGFCFYYYNFNGKRILDRPVEDFLARQDLDFPFCVMWANENWTRRWDGAESELLIKQDYTDDDAEALIDDLARHFKDPRYIRIQGRPILFLYRADVIPQPKSTIEHWRQLFASRHDEQPWIFMAQSFGNNDPAVFGFDGAIEFPPHKVVANANVVNSECHVFDNNFAARVYRYKDIIDSAMSEAVPSFPLIKTVFPSWDNDARRQGQGMSVTGSSPKLYMEWLDQAIRFANANPFVGESFVCINAWNEWTEGAYLEPDIHYGGAYLNATARVIAGIGYESPRKRIVLAGHNAFPAGAQMLLLNLAKTLKRQFGAEILILLCGGGKMSDDYAAVAPTQIVTEKLPIEDAVQQIALGGFDGAIVNSVGSGSAAAYLKSKGLKVVALVHEMPRLMSENHLLDYARELAKYSDEVIFPSPIVRDAFLDYVGPVAGTCSLRPQGIYSQLQRVPGAREKLLRDLKLPDSARIVLNVGYGDLRKGIDIFCSIASLVARTNPDVYFVWAGDIHLHLRSWIDDPEANPKVRFLGHRPDVAALMSAADIFALTSREDPYPSVVLEAQSLGVPVICFEKSGGAADLVSANGFGSVVPYGDTAAFASAVNEWLDKGSDTTAEMGEQIAEEMDRSSAFDDYAFDLMQRIIPGLRRISVIVPNYNYAKYIEGRLSSIFKQNHPIFELILLDDCSTDDSLGIATAFADSENRRIEIVKNQSNSGSPFAQWKLGLSLARGDLVWIAEADDLAEPNFLSKMASAFLNSETILATCDSKPIGSDGQALDLSYKAYYSKVQPGALAEDFVAPAREFACTYLAQRNVLLNVSGILWRKDVLLAAFHRTEASLSTFSLAGDWLLYLAACESSGTVAYFSAEMNLHRRHDGGVTSRTKGELQIDEVARVHEFFRDRFGADAEFEEQQRQYIDELCEQFGVHMPSQLESVR